VTSQPEAEQAGPAPSLQGWRVPRHRFAACGLDRLSPARQGLAKQVRLNRNWNAFDLDEGIALLANTCPLETSGILASNEQKPTAASIFTLRYDA
jgi:hypothetical protein